MRWIAIAFVSAFLTGCAHADLPPPPPPPPPIPAPTTDAPITPAIHAGIPKVVARILRQEKELVERSRDMAKALPDPRGRASAERETLALVEELDAIEAPIDAADSEKLDAIVDKLAHLEGRIELLYLDLHAATDKASPVAPD